jgi:SAM-dependent methyltransferase
MSDVMFDDWALQQVRERRFLINRFDEWIYDEISPYLGQRVLEIGCGLGNLMRLLLDRELVVGIDPDRDSINHLRLAYNDRTNLQAHPLDICDPKVLELKASHFDTVVSLNVFEHIEDDVGALRHIRELLEPGGHLVLIVPAHSWLYGTMDSSIGHYRRYDKALMNDKLAQAGFVPVVQKYLNVLGMLGWFVNGRILRQRVPPSDQLRLFNLIVPMLRAVERRYLPPVGLSLMSVAR